MYSKRSVDGDGPDSRPVRTSDRLRSRPKFYNRSYMYYPQTIIRSTRKKTKSRTAAAQIAKMLRQKRTSKANVRNIIVIFMAFLLFDLLSRYRGPPSLAVNCNSSLISCVDFDYNWADAFLNRSKRLIFQLPGCSCLISEKMHNMSLLTCCSQWLPILGALLGRGGFL